MGIPAVGIFLAACAGPQIRDGAYANAAKRFVVPLPSAGWTVEMDAGPDLLLRHESRQAGISVHATCGEIPADRRVEIASRHLFFGIQDKQVLRDEPRAGSPEEGSEVLLRGHVEGRDLLLHGYTVKGSGCLYDLVLFAAPEDYAEVDGEFEALVHGFRRSSGQTR
ncbi:MAG: hypothetical protein HYU41_14875 [Candidatus Rokubacteria bacterium]|nr:hypothetical protein [Candidatus Rokubacteria bacterium]